MSADLEAVRAEVHRWLLRSLPADAPADRAAVEQGVQEVSPLLNAADTERLIARVTADVHGLGVLEPLLADPAVTDVMVVGERGVWVERSGKIIEASTRMSSREVMRLIERIIAPLGLRVDRSSPMVDARLPDGSRVNVVVAPLAVDGPCLTIRRFGARPIALSEIASEPVARLLSAAVHWRWNILVSGGTGAGKTTLLNALGGYISPSERIITVEDAAELKLPLRHVVRLESRPANTEGVGRVELRALVRNALRMRPDRIIVGEVRGPEALDMLQAMNTGHEGSMSTCHANSPQDALRRIETMVLMGEVALPLVAIRQQMASSIDLIVQVSRTSDGARCVTDVSEVTSGETGPDVRQIADQNHLIATPTKRFNRPSVAA